MTIPEGVILSGSPVLNFRGVQLDHPVQSDFDQMSHTNEDLSVKIVEKERQVREVGS